MNFQLKTTHDTVGYLKWYLTSEQNCHMKARKRKGKKKEKARQGEVR